jgi:hypothetical protein
MMETYLILARYLSSLTPPVSFSFCLLYPSCCPFIFLGQHWGVKCVYSWIYRFPIKLVLWPLHDSTISSQQFEAYVAVGRPRDMTLRMTAVLISE